VPHPHFPSGCVPPSRRTPEYSSYWDRRDAFTQSILVFVTALVIREATPADAQRLADLRYRFRSALRTSVEDKEVFIRSCSGCRASYPSLIVSAGLPPAMKKSSGQVWLHLIEKLPNPNGSCELHAYVTNT
jgi:hypothetical protein